jgi:hypothetical protein
MHDSKLFSACPREHKALQKDKFFKFFVGNFSFLGSGQDPKSWMSTAELTHCCSVICKAKTVLNYSWFGPLEAPAAGGVP